MLSVLIPVYNYNVFPLIEEIHKQLIESKIVFEIICFDDASKETIPHTSKNLEFFIFQKLEKNIGRSKIRNLLAENAKYNWLLFLDADVLPKDSNFINKYLGLIHKNVYLLVCGGIEYQDEKPEKEKTLRWIYGKKREEASLTSRKRNPYHHFLSANFLIKKTILSNIGFNENLREYGHEDTLFALNLQKSRVTLRHINNLVYHRGIETNNIFLKKTKKAVENAFYLYKKGLFKKNDLNLINAFEKLESLRVSNLTGKIFKVFDKKLEANLKSSTPSMFLFDIYKLGYLCSISRK